MKKLLIIGAVVFLAGALIFTGALAAAGWDITALSTVPEYELKTFVAENKGLDITVDNIDTPVKLGTSDDGRIHLEYYNNEKQYYVINESNGLTVERVDTYEWYERFLQIDLYETELTLLLPENYSGNIHITNTNGGLTADGITVSGTFYQKTSNGNVTLKNVTAQSVEVKTSNGSVTVSGSETASTLKATTSNGNIRLTDSVFGGDATVRTSNGDVTAADCAAVSTLDIKTSNGNIGLNGLTCAAVAARTSNGSISTDSVDAASSIYLKTSNGNIKGSVEGSMNDYAIISDTSNGNNNLPGNKPDGGRSLEVRTSNGDIKITFAN